ncbi:hypothetical protein Ciccas_007508, partial [Cichlidogyrus casuarinus]
LQRRFDPQIGLNQQSATNQDTSENVISSTNYFGDDLSYELKAQGTEGFITLATANTRIQQLQRQLAELRDKYFSVENGN